MVILVLGVPLVTFYVSLTLFVMPTRGGWPLHTFLSEVIITAIVLLLLLLLLLLLVVVVVVVVVVEHRCLVNIYYHAKNLSCSFKID